MNHKISIFEYCQKKKWRLPCTSEKYKDGYWKCYFVSVDSRMSYCEHLQSKFYPSKSLAEIELYDLAWNLVLINNKKDPLTPLEKVQKVLKRQTTTKSLSSLFHELQQKGKLSIIKERTKIISLTPSVCTGTLIVKVGNVLYEAKEKETNKQNTLILLYRSMRYKLLGLTPPTKNEDTDDFDNKTLSLQTRDFLTPTLPRIDKLIISEPHSSKVARSKDFENKTNNDSININFYGDNDGLEYTLRSVRETGEESVGSENESEQLWLQEQIKLINEMEEKEQKLKNDSQKKCLPDPNNGKTPNHGYDEIKIRQQIRELEIMEEQKSLAKQKEQAKQEREQCLLRQLKEKEEELQRLEKQRQIEKQKIKKQQQKELEDLENELYIQNLLLQQKKKKMNLNYDIDSNSEQEGLFDDSGNELGDEFYY